jgi:PIN domain nuclease of toxin-antitoxin system
MRLLLDTNVLLFVMAGDARVEHLEGRIVSDDNEVYVSAASYWEVAIKNGIGKLAIDVAQLRHAANASGFIELPVTGAHTEYLMGLPSIHKDRILVAQATAEPMRLLTTDAVLAGYGAQVEVV